MWAALRSGIIVILLTLGFGTVGLLCGEMIGYGIAGITRRDPAELKDMLIWCFITAPPLFAATGFWLTIRMLTERIWLKRLALTVFLIVAFCSTTMIVLTYLDAPRYS